MDLLFQRLSITSVLASAALLTAGAASANASFSSAVATYNQAGFNVSSAIDGSTVNNTGWAISEFSNINGNSAQDTNSQTALFTLGSAVAPGANDFTFTLTQLYSDPYHTLGDFSLAFTTDAVPLLGGPQTAFDITSATSSNGASFAFTGDHLLVTGNLPATDIYTITAHSVSGSAITGIYLNAINDPAYNPTTGGPGRQPVNGNFVLTEFDASAVASRAGAVPEPATWGLMIMGLGAVGTMLRRRRVHFQAA